MPDQIFSGDRAIRRKEESAKRRVYFERNKSYVRSKVVIFIAHIKSVVIILNKLN